MSLTQIQKDNIIETIKKIVLPMNVACDVSIREEMAGDKEIVVAAISAPEDAKFLIGKNGQNLQALEHVTRSLLLKQTEGVVLFVDVNDYKKSRATQVASLAKEAVL